MQALILKGVNPLSESRYHSYPLDESEGDIFNCTRRTVQDVDGLTIRTGGYKSGDVLEFEVCEAGGPREDDLKVSTIVDADRVYEIWKVLGKWLGMPEISQEHLKALVGAAVYVLDGEEANSEFDTLRAAVAAAQELLGEDEDEKPSAEEAAEAAKRVAASDEAFRALVGGAQ